MDMMSDEARLELGFM